jgi:pyrimidine-nucleoside phosphorylase
MSEEETSVLTNQMLYSGRVIDLSAISGMKIDKHSTGGVGDKTSLIIAPICAAAGVYVPMISGRGLGHTGGTLDKLESIPGFRIDLSLAEYKKVLKKCGAVLIGQTKDIAPADKLIYALRDVTGTVESIPLIASSIMSKKLAEGIDGLVLDVKTGNGAFMSEYSQSVKHAETLVKIAKSFNKTVFAFITDMNQPLGKYIGNWFEVYESIKVLQGEDVHGLTELSHNLAGAMLVLGKKAGNLQEGIGLSKEMVSSGKAMEKFIQIVELQGGETKYIINPDKYPQAKFSKEIKFEKSGYLTSVNTYGLGIASLELGAGRMRKEDPVDPKAGIIFNYNIGDKVMAGDISAVLYYNSKKSIESVGEKFYNLYEVGETKPAGNKLIRDVIQ